MDKRNLNYFENINRLSSDVEGMDMMFKDPNLEELFHEQAPRLVLFF